jgi:O-antigen/teichoic acid export membrane protein
VLAALVGTQATGVYVAAYGLASQPFLLAANVLGLTFRPIYNAAAVRGDRVREREVFLLWLALVVLVLSAGLALMAWLAEPLTSLLLAADYGAAAGLLPWIGAAYALQGCTVVFDAVVYAQKRTRTLVVVQLVAAPVSLALYFLLIPRLEAFGAALATFAGTAVWLVTIVVLSGALRRLVFPARAPLP